MFDINVVGFSERGVSITKVGRIKDFSVDCNRTEVERPKDIQQQLEKQTPLTQ